MVSSPNPLKIRKGRGVYACVDHGFDGLWESIRRGLHLVGDEVVFVGDVCGYELMDLASEIVGGVNMGLHAGNRTREASQGKAVLLNVGQDGTDWTGGSCDSDGAKDLGRRADGVLQNDGVHDFAVHGESEDAVFDVKEARNLLGNTGTETHELRARYTLGRAGGQVDLQDVALEEADLVVVLVEQELVLAKGFDDVVANRIVAKVEGLAHLVLRRARIGGRSQVRAQQTKQNDQK